MDVDHDKVRADLEASIKAHQAALLARTHHDPGRAREFLTDAAQYRLMAHQRDPGHTAAVWQDEQQFTPKGRDTHAEMCAFYRAQGVWNG